MTPSENLVKRPTILPTILIAALVAALLGIVAGASAAWFVGRHLGTTVSLTTPYQAVVLNNGTAYFGKLEGFGGPYPVLKEVYYVQKVTNPDTRQENNILVKRGHEMHAPDSMILNANNIIFVEPVSRNSRVAQLIDEQKSK